MSNEENMQDRKKKVLVSVPPPLLKKLDRSALKQGRNRSVELCIRLGASFKGKPEKSEVAA